MKLTKDDIQFIDRYLDNQDIKYLDIRTELIDHLATDYEDNSKYSLLIDYLNTKVNFITDFAKKQQKTIHWSYQKQLWVQFAKFFYEPKFMILGFGFAVLGYILLQSLSLKTFGIIYYFGLMALIIYPLFYQIKYSKALKKVQSMQSLFTLTALPSVFLYAFLSIKEILIKNPKALIVYCSLSILLGVSAIILIEKNRKKILVKYKQLVGEI